MEHSIDKAILESVEPAIVRIIEAYKKDAQDNDRKWTQFDETMTRLRVTRGLLRSVSMYLDINDRIVLINHRIDKGANITITATLLRNDKTFYISTEVIIAEGQIQRAHYRYITKSSLPSNKQRFMSPELKAIELKIKQMTKRQKLDAEIKRYQNWITETETKTKAIEALTNDQKVELYASKYYFKPIKLIQDIPQAAPIRQDIKTQYELDQYNINWYNECLYSMNRDIELGHRRIVSLRKAIDKIESKIQKLGL